MKRGAKVYLVNTDGDAVGPFNWRLIRKWHALAGLSPDAMVFVVGEEEWKPLRDHPTMIEVKDKLEDFEVGRAASQHQMQYMQLLKMPFYPPTSYVARDAIKAFVEACPHLENKFLERISLTALKYRGPWREEPATENQIAFLKSKGIKTPKSLTKGQASGLIDPITEPQKRRLKFYGHTLEADTTKEEAIMLLDAYCEEFSHKEAEYQESKKQKHQGRS